MRAHAQFRRAHAIALYSFGGTEIRKPENLTLFGSGKGPHRIQFIKGRIMEAIRRRVLIKDGCIGLGWVKKLRLNIRIKAIAYLCRDLSVKES
jgi:hypothetical protein